MLYYRAYLFLIKIAGMFPAALMIAITSGADNCVPAQKKELIFFV